VFISPEPVSYLYKERRKTGRKKTKKANRGIEKIAIEEEENDKESNENCSTCYVNGFCKFNPFDRLRRHGKSDNNSSPGSDNSSDGSSYYENGGNNSRDEETACSGYFIRIIRNIMEKHHDRSTGYGRQRI